MASEIEDRVILSFSYFYFLHKTIFWLNLISSPFEQCSYNTQYSLFYSIIAYDIIYYLNIFNIICEFICRTTYWTKIINSCVNERYVPSIA